MSEENKQLEVTSVDTIKEKIEGKVVPMPGWDEDSINVKLKRPSLMGLVKKGKVPNQLLGVVEKAIDGQIDEVVKKEEQGFQRVVQLFDIIAEEAIVDPPYDVFEGELTDEQQFFIFSYALRGIQELTSFRERYEAALEARDGMREVEREAERDDQS